jgi:hypothetical protein
MTTRQKHVRGGNCWAGNTKSDVCKLHEEPRGECDQCPRCPTCSEREDMRAVGDEQQ